MNSVFDIMTATRCGAIRWEIRGPMFDLVERDSSTITDVDATTPPVVCLDVIETFSPHPRMPYIATKAVLAGWIGSVLGMSIMKQKHKSFFLAYLTHWILVIALGYIIVSTLCAVYLAHRPPARSDGLDGNAGAFVKCTWTLFAIAAPGQVMVTILFWTLEYDPDKTVITYLTLMTHGIVMVLIMIDGLVLSRIPLRMKQVVFSETVTFLFALWTVVHAFSGMGNPYADGEDATRDDDAIYNSIAWKDNPDGAAIVSVVVLFVVNPVIFLAYRTLSRLLPRRLCEDGGGTGNTDEEAVSAN